jgi:16S rRNA (guanine527-N7)-methyltransferase
MNQIFNWGVDVSRETSERLERYEELLKKWNPAINLVSKSTIEDLRTRHIADSAQLSKLAPLSTKSWVDIGSGGGFPGLVCCILAKEFMPETSFQLIESDTRKATFLRTVARDTGVSIEVHSERIERVTPLSADLLSARALASLDKLLEFSERHLAKGGIALFQKGARYRDELEEAQKRWKFSFEEIQSTTDAQAVVLKIGDIERV